MQPIILQDDAGSRLVVAAPKAKTVDSKDNWDVSLTGEEAATNPQINQQRQKALKLAKKSALKRAQKTTDQDAMDIDQDYDFARDFAQ